MAARRVTIQAALSRINVFPIKSFDGVAVESSEFVPGGGLKFDRRFASSLSAVSW